MSELKTRFIDDTYVEYFNTGKHELAQIYLKSEADKVIAELKAKLESVQASMYADIMDDYISDIQGTPDSGLAIRNNELMAENKSLKDEVIDLRRYRDSLEKRIHELSIALEHTETKA